MVEEVNENLMQKDNQEQLDDSEFGWLIEGTCADRSYGARPLRRAIQKHIEDTLAEDLIRGDIEAGDRVQVTVSDADLSFRVCRPEKAESSVAK